MNIEVYSYFIWLSKVEMNIYVEIFIGIFLVLFFRSGEFKLYGMEYIRVFYWVLINYFSKFIR